MTDTTCEVEGCEKVRTTRGLCRMHYNRLLRNGTTELVGRAYVRNHCAVDGCEKPVNGHGLCNTHYRRKVRTGTTDDPPPRRKDLRTRLWGRIVVLDTGCWFWTGSQAPGGYGEIWYEGRKWRVHRLVYELLVGPIGEPHTDHLCRVTACCNPEHIEPVSAAENLRRSWADRLAGLPRSTHASHVRHLPKPKT